MIYTELPWYDDRVTHLQNDLTPSRPLHALNMRNSSPRNIYDYLNERVWKQDEAKKTAAMLMWKTLNGIKENIMFCGPTGCGKTEIWRQLKELYPDRISIVDASSLTQSGWKGETKWTTLLDAPCFRSDYHTILVMDEIDKMISPKFTYGGENVAQSVMCEGLKILEGTLANVTRNGSTYQVDTGRISFVLLGAFSNKASDIAEKSRGSSIGFTTSYQGVAPYTKQFTVQDIIDFGAMPEFMGRINKLINLEPITQNDYTRMLTHSAYSPIQRLEQQYRIKLHLSPEKQQELAKNAYESGLGVRELTNQLVRLIDSWLFETPEKQYLEL